MSDRRITRAGAILLGDVPTGSSLVDGMLRVNPVGGALEFRKGSAWTAPAIVGGANTQIQFNASGALSGSADLTYDSNHTTGGLTIGNTTVSTTTSSGALKVAGGIGVAGSIHSGGTVQIHSADGGSVGDHGGIDLRMTGTVVASAAQSINWYQDGVKAGAIIGERTAISTATDLKFGVRSNAGSFSTLFRVSGVGFVDATVPFYASTEFRITGGTFTAAALPVFNSSATWNNVAVPFTGWSLDITNTASAVSSKLVDLRADSVSVWSVDADGWTYQKGQLNLDVPVAGSDFAEFSHNGDIRWYHGADGRISQSTDVLTSGSPAYNMASTWDDSEAANGLNLNVTIATPGASSYFTMFSHDGGGGLTEKFTVMLTGLIKGAGLQMSTLAANPGNAATLWVNSGDANKLYFGAAAVGGGGSASGDDGSVQFATSGAFDSSEDLNFNGTNLFVGSEGDVSNIGFGNLTLTRTVLGPFETLIGAYNGLLQKWLLDSDGWTTQAGTLTVDLPVASTDGFMEFKQDSVTHFNVDNNGLVTITSKEYDSGNSTLAVRSTWNTASSPSVLSLDITDTASGLTSAFLVGVYNTTEVINWRKDGQLSYTASVSSVSTGTALGVTATATGATTTTLNGLNLSATGDSVNTINVYGLYIVAQGGTTLNEAAHFAAGNVLIENGDLFVSSDILVGNRLGGPAGSLFVVRGLSAAMTGSADYNVGVGVGAFNDLTDAANCVAVGFQALAGVTTGYSNVGIGSQAGAGITTGLSNVCVGTYAGTAIVDGNSNVCIGDAAGQQLTSGGDNVLIGAGAGYSLTTDNKGIHIGFNAGYFETEGDHLYIDNRNRNSEAAGRTSALIFGTFADAVADQQLTINGVFETNAGRIIQQDSIDASAACDNTHHAVKIIDTGVTLTLPEAPPDGREIMVANRGGGSGTIEAGGTDTIEGAATLVLADDESVILVYDAALTDWTIYASY